MATLINWFEDPLRKKLQQQTQVPTRSANVTLGRLSSASAAPRINTSATPAPVQTKPVSASNTLRSLRTPIKANTSALNTLNTLSSSRKNSLTKPETTTTSQSKPLTLSTIKNDSNRTPIVSSTLGTTALRTATQAPIATKIAQSTGQTTGLRELALNNKIEQNITSRADQAKQRYNDLRDNNNEFWNKYSSAMETTRNGYKDVFGQTSQQKSSNQLGKSLYKLQTDQGTLPSSGDELVNRYRSLSDDDKWDVWQNLQKAKSTLTQAIGKADDEGNEELKNAYATLLSEVSVYDDIIASEDRGKKSIGKSFSDWMSSGGFVGGMAQPATNALGTLAEIAGNKGGAETSRAISDDNATADHGNHGLVGALDFAGSTIGNIAANMATGGAYGLVNSGLGLADSASSAITDRNRNYSTDADGNLIRENQSTASKLAGVGNAGLNAGMTLLGMKGIGPNINFKDGQTLQGLLANKNYGEIGKALGGYAAKELPWALGQTAASQAILAAGGDQEFGDNFGQELANNIIGDLAIDLTGAIRQGASGNRDLLKPGDENDPSAIQRLQQLGYKINEEINKRGGIGLTTKDVGDPKQDDLTLSRLLDELWGKTDNSATPSRSRQSYDEAASAQRLNDLAEGKLSYDDYSKYQSDRLWEAFQDSNGGVETFLKGANQYESDGSRADVSRHAVSENGALYRQLYDEYGRKPSHKLFNSALEDVLTKGDQSKYYNAFKELNPEVGLYNAGSDDIDTLISTREYTNTPEYQAMTQQNRPNLAQKAINKVDEVYTKAINTNAVNRLEKSLTEAMNGGTKGNTKFVRLTKETLNDINQVRQAQGMNPLTKRQVTAYENAINNNLVNRINEGMTARQVTEIAFNSLTSPNAEALPGKGKNTVMVAPYEEGKYSGSVLGITRDGDTSLKSIEPRHKSQVENLRATKKGLTDHGSPLATSQEGGVIQSSGAARTSLDGQSLGASVTSPRVLDDSVSQNPTNVKQNQSKFSTDTATRSQELSDDFRTQLKSDSNNTSKSYEVVSDKTALENTAKFMDGKTLTEAESDITSRLNKKLGTADKQDISDALAVVKKLEQKGDTASFERAEQIIDKISQHATKSGQNIQALSLLSNKTPEGLLYGATKELKKNGVEVTPKLRQQLQGNIKGIVEERRHANTAKQALDTASQKIDDAIMDGKATDFTKLIKDMKDAGSRYRAADDQLAYSYARLSKTVADQTPQSAGNIYSSLIKGGMLSAPTTHGKNITSNATFSVMKKAADLVGAGVDQVASVFTGKRAAAFTLRGEGEGLARGTKYALTTLKTGLEEGADTSKYSSGNAELRFKNKIVDTVLGKPNRAVFRLMSAGDKSFRYAEQMNNLYEQATVSAKNQGLAGDAREAYIQRFVNNPSMEALSKAMDAGEKAVLGQQNKAASAISGLVQGLKKSDNSGVRVLGTFVDAHVMPFVKVPTNFLTEAMSYTPLQLGAEMAHQIDSIKAGQGFNQASFSKSLGKVAVGSGIIAALAVGEQIANSVEISGDYPEDAQEQARWQTEGIQENSIKIGDRWYKLEAFGPFALFAGAGVNFKKSLDQGMGALDATTTALANFTSALADQSFLTGISDLTDLMTGGTDLGTAGTSWVRSQVSSLVPNIVKKAASATDPYQRAYDSHAGLGTNVTQAITGSIPGLRQATLDKKVDVYGNKLKNGSFISGFLDPTGSSKALQSDNAVVQEVARLKQVAENGSAELSEDDVKLLSATPNKIKTNLSSGRENYTLTDKQVRELQTLTGRKITQVYGETISSQKYKDASDLDKAAMLKQARTAATTLAKNEFAAQNNFSQSKLTGDAKKMANGTFEADATAAEGTTKRSNGTIEINDTISDEYKKTLDTYNSMDKEDWEKHIYSDEGRSAEYQLAAAKYENDKANGELTEVEDVKRKKELRKLKVSQNWNKDVRDAYSLAGSKTDIQGLLDELDNRDDMVGYLNALNRAMYDAGVITASTYKSRNRNINNLESSTSGSGRSKSKSTYSNAANSALSAYTKALAGGNAIKVNKAPSAPSTSRKLSALTLATNIKKSNLGAQAKVSVKKGIN